VGGVYHQPRNVARHQSSDAAAPTRNLIVFPNAFPEEGHHDESPCVCVALCQTSCESHSGHDVKSSDIQTVLKRVMVNLTTPVSDTPVRTVDAGGHNIGIGVV